MKQEKDAIQARIKTEEIRYGQLEGIEELYYVGQMAPRSLKGVEIAEDGTVSVNGPPVKTGTVSNLNLISAMPGLRKLALIKQPVKDVSGLSRIMRLQEVNLACSEVSSLKGLEELPSLQTLNLIHTKVNDLEPLGGLPSLDTVIVSTDMLPIVLDPEASYDVVLVR